MKKTTRVIQRALLAEDVVKSLEEMKVEVEWRNDESLEFELVRNEMIDEMIAAIEGLV